MSKFKRPDPKSVALRDQGILHPRPEKVTSPLFVENDFFDPRDAVQVKYEMLRCIEADGRSLTEAAAAFGFSRPSLYKAQAAFAAGGLPALLPRRRGPHRAHKLTAEVLDFVERCVVEDPTLHAPALAQRIEQDLALRVHPRSIERALARRKKNGTGNL